MTAMSPQSRFLAPHIIEPGAHRPFWLVSHFGACQGSHVPLEFQSAKAGPPANLADGPVRGGQRPADLLLRAILGRWQVHCEIIANRSIS